MKKDHELEEAPVAGGDFRPVADQFAGSYKKFYELHSSEFKHVGDVETYPCYQHGLLFFLLDAGQIIFICKLEDFYYENNAKKLDSVWLDSAYQGKQIFSKMLWFLRSREGYTKLVLGDIHSQDTRNLLRRGGLSKFDKTWVNINTREREKFSPETMDKFYLNNNSVWKLLLESNAEGDDLAKKVKEFRYSFMTDLNLGYTNAIYDWQIE